MTQRPSGAFETSDDPTFTRRQWMVESMISFEEARDFVLTGLHPLTPAQVPLKDALGLVTAEAIHAREPSPRFANSSMDGFAVRSKDTVEGASRLTIVDSIFAGDQGVIVIGEREAARIMTGAPLPPGADSVCMREEATVDTDGTTVLIERSIAYGEFVRLVGDDVAVDEELVGAGNVIDPALLGVLASQGFESVLAHPRPRVGIVSTGNELSDGATALDAAQIRDANRPSLLASLEQSGCIPVDLGIAKDTPGDIAEAFQRGSESCDAIVSTGGVSVGDADFVKSVLGELTGGNARSMQVAIRPGKPFSFGVAPSGMPYFGLAGNPVSTLVGFELFVRPALRVLSGRRDVDRPLARMILDCPLPRRRDGKLNLVHVTSRLDDDGRFHVTKVARLGSHLLNAIAGANAIAMVPDGDGLDEGQEVMAMILNTEDLNGRAWRN
jgi:molybdenum cofactor synthesis domain-containing protein